MARPGLSALTVDELQQAAKALMRLRTEAESPRLAAVYGKLAALFLRESLHRPTAAAGRDWLGEFARIVVDDFMDEVEADLSAEHGPEGVS